MEALTERGVECRFEDCVAFGGQKLSATVSNVYVKFVQAAPDAFGRLYRFAKAISTPHIKSPSTSSTPPTRARWSSCCSITRRI